jgi:hypothetical protein
MHRADTFAFRLVVAGAAQTAHAAHGRYAVSAEPLVQRLRTGCGPATDLISADRWPSSHRAPEEPGVVRVFREEIIAVSGCQVRVERAGTSGRKIRHVDASPRAGEPVRQVEIEVVRDAEVEMIEMVQRVAEMIERVAYTAGAQVTDARSLVQRAGRGGSVRPGGHQGSVGFQYLGGAVRELGGQGPVGIQCGRAAVGVGDAATGVRM